MREEFHLHELLWLGYLVYSLDNCVIKLYIETGLMPLATAVVLLIKKQVIMAVRFSIIIFWRASFFFKRVSLKHKMRPLKVFSNFRI
jgi:hypothetical protein